MTGMRFVVGCSAAEYDREAIALAWALADATGAELHLVHVIPGRAPERAASAQEGNYQEFLRGEAEEPMRRLRDLVPPGMPVSSHIVYADTPAVGLLDAVEALGAGLVVVGTSRRSPFRRFTVGSTATALLRKSIVPIALAPSGYRPPRGITRITCAIGTRVGHGSLLEVATDAAARRHAPLRLVSLVTVDAHRSGQQATGWAEAHAKVILDQAVDAVDRRTLVRADIAPGRTIEEAVDNLDWDESEIVLIGSSRLARRNHIFLGHAAHRIVHTLPVPVVVVPRDRPSLDRMPTDVT